MGNAEITGASFEDKRRAFRATAELIVADATRRVEKTLQNLQRTDLPLPDDKVRAGIVEKVIDDFVGKPEEKKPKKSKSKSMGYEDLTRMAYRRLAEELLRTGIKNYSVKLEIGPFEYFVQHYRPLLQRLASVRDRCSGLMRAC